MSRMPKPTPPKPCPICQVAMQMTAEAGATVHRCERCGTVISVAKPAGAAAAR
jgi:Transcription factor zinc-finger